MKQAKNRRLSLQVGSLLVMVVVITTMAEETTPHPTDRNSTLMSFYCSPFKHVSADYFFSNLNTTLSSLRQQLTTGGYAEAHTLFNGVPVWGLASCRGYLSIPNCLDCFDYAVSQLKSCGHGNGAQVTYNDCYLRYEFNNFYTQANIHNFVLCGNDTSPQQRQFTKATKRLLLDLQNAAPRAPKFYVASTRNVDVGTTTVYAIAQCNLNVNEDVCLKCLQLRSASLYGCLPRTDGRAMDNPCFMRYSRTPFFGQKQTTDISSLLWHRKSRKIIYIIGVVGVLGLLSLVLAIFLWCGRSKKTIRDHQEEAQDLKGAFNYDYKHLQLATNNFSKDNIIGKGGFGEVFKAILDDKKVVAVKKLKATYARAKVEYENEISLISHIHHRNLLGLLGWSSEVSDLLLVLEYMPNGSLDKFLWGEKKGTLSWIQRYDIILGIARGLTHLHKEFHFKIVHRDIKSSNILLDDDFQPKIADFGLARFQPDHRSHITTKFSGTLGYTAPEYILYGHLSDKVDTFSFGIVILEIISGRKCSYSNFNGPSTKCLLEHAWTLYENKEHMKLVDETMGVNHFVEEQVMKIIEIALLCTQSPASKRPTMSEVVLMLPVDPSLGESERHLSRPNFIGQSRRIDHIGPS